MRAASAGHAAGKYLNENMSRWHDRLKAEARTCLAKQVIESDKRLPKAGLNNGLTCQWLDPPLFGKGRMNAF